MAGKVLMPFFINDAIGLYQTIDITAEQRNTLLVLLAKHLLNFIQSLGYSYNHHTLIKHDEENPSKPA